VESRSGGWLKIKCSGRQEFVIGGFTDPQGSRTGFGALLIGYFDPSGKKFKYAGKVGTGFNDALLRDLHGQLKKIETPKSPFAATENLRGYRKVHWVKPKLVAEIGFSEWTRDGLLRHPRFEGLRDDKKATTVVRES